MYNKALDNRANRRIFGFRDRLSVELQLKSGRGCGKLSRARKLTGNSVNCWTADHGGKQPWPAVGVYSSATAEGMMTRQSFGMGYSLDDAG